MSSTSNQPANRNRKPWRKKIVRRRGWLLLEQLEVRRLLSFIPDATDYVSPQYALLDLNGFLSEPSTAPPIDIARNYLLAHVNQLGLMPADVASASITNEVVSGPSGTTHLYLQQTLEGLAVANARLNINVAANGQIISVGSGFVSGQAAPPQTPS